MNDDGLLAFGVFKTYSLAVSERAPDDPDAFKEWVEDGGLEPVFDELLEQYSRDEVFQAVRKLNEGRLDVE